MIPLAWSILEVAAFILGSAAFATIVMVAAYLFNRRKKPVPTLPPAPEPPPVSSPIVTKGLIPPPTEAGKELSALLNQQPIRVQDTVAALDTSTPKMKTTEEYMTPLTASERITLERERIRIERLERKRRAEILERQRRGA